MEMSHEFGWRDSELAGGRIRVLGAAKFGAWTDKIRIFGTRILREGWGTDFGSLMSRFGLAMGFCRDELRVS